jgi:hypothetical protein
MSTTLASPVQGGNRPGSKSGGHLRFLLKSFGKGNNAVELRFIYLAVVVDPLFTTTCGENATQGWRAATLVSWPCLCMFRLPLGGTLETRRGLRRLVSVIGCAGSGSRILRLMQSLCGGPHFIE